MRFKRSFAMGVAVTSVCGVPSSAATVSRRRTYPDLNRVYKRLMLVYESVTAPAVPGTAAQSPTPL
jgi:hypothetical protein